MIDQPAAGSPSRVHRGSTAERVAGLVVVVALPSAALAYTFQLAGGGGALAATRLAGLRTDVIKQLQSPWFWFGMVAQGVFFMRFMVQWIASERQRRSTVPVAFWWLSLVGGLSLFVYAAGKLDLVIMAGQLLSCFIYVRNLMLIRDFELRRRQAGLPVPVAGQEQR